VNELPPRSEVADQLFLIMEQRNAQAGWRWFAACKGMDPDIFFAGKGPGANDHARAICGRCPVRADCLRDLGQYYGGFIGGMTTTQRVKAHIAKLRLAEREMSTFIVETEPEEIAALDLGIKANSINRRRHRAAKKTQETTT
jgi:WhiB family redox-sensing transcriptional regulator